MTTGETTTGDDLIASIAALRIHQCERLLQSVMEQLIADLGGLAATNEAEARELIAAVVGKDGDEVYAEQVVPATVEPEVFVRGTLELLAADSATRPLVRSGLAGLSEDSQMFVDPISAALVLGALVALLQTKIHFKVVRKAGKLEVEFSLDKKSASDETVGKTLDAVRRLTTG